MLKWASFNSTHTLQQSGDLQIRVSEAEQVMIAASLRLPFK